MEPIDPALYERPDLRTALAAHQFGPVFDALNTHAGLSYREIGRRTDTHESVIYEIRKGRTVENYAVLERIADGLTIPREFVGLSYGESADAESDTYPEQVTVADPEGAEEMRRRALLAAGAAASLGWPLLGDVPELTAPAAQPLPAKLDMIHVDTVADLLAWVRPWTRAHGGQADVVGAATDRALQLMTVPGDDQTRARLASVLAELHTEAGWTYFDSSADNAARHYYMRAMSLARKAGDRYQIAHALRHAGMLPLEREQPDDALKLFQFGQVTFTLPGTPLFGDDPRVAPLLACLDSLQARALARMDRPDLARAKLAAARDAWQPPDKFAQADADYRNAEVALRLGQLDLAEHYITLSTRAWGTRDRRPAANAGILRATIHVQAGERDGAQLAHNAITAVRKLSSTRARQRLEPLAEVLDARPGADARELARMARQVATTRV